MSEPQTDPSVLEQIRKRHEDVDRLRKAVPLLGELVAHADRGVLLSLLAQHEKDLDEGRRIFRAMQQQRDQLQEENDKMKERLGSQ